MKHLCTKYIGLILLLVLSGCAAEELVDNSEPAVPVNPQELEGVKALIDGEGAATRVDPPALADYVGRDIFVGNDRIVFTSIKRTASPYPDYSYPAAGATYEGIVFQRAVETDAWKRVVGEGEPERIYWTDASNNHTFIAYSKPQAYGACWKKYENYYLGALGDPTVVADDPATDSVDESIIDYSTGNAALQNEDLVIAWDNAMQAEPGGSVALVKFHHALASVRVVVSISGFSSSATAADNAARVSDMRLLHQPTMYVWKQLNAQAEPLRVSGDQDMVNTAWGVSAPEATQRKDLRLWIPAPDGVGTNQSRTFTFYGITTPQPSIYMSTLDPADENRKAEIQFNVNYPDPMNPDDTSKNKNEIYKATLENVYFWAGYNTTINISLNHQNEKMTVGAEYDNWEFAATPDQGELHKHSTFLESTLESSVTIHTTPGANADDATWLYNAGAEGILDIYGHTGDSDTDAYQIRTADQLLSFAYEVKRGNKFTGKFVRLDADITLQASSDLTKEEIVYTSETASAYGSAALALDWPGIGDAENPFDGEFIGGDRYIYRLKGSPLFVALGPNAWLGHMTVNALPIGTHKPEDVTLATKAINGGGLFAQTNAGHICGCYISGDVSLSGTTSGAFVGTNAAGGVLFCSYHIGNTIGTTNVGGLVGSNSGIVGSCYQAGSVTGTNTQGIAFSSTEILDNNFYMSASEDRTVTGSAGVTASYMTKNAFVEEINAGIVLWRNGDGTLEHTAHSDYHNHRYVYQPANYPRLAD